MAINKTRIDWLLFDDSEAPKPISSFVPEVIAVVDVYTENSDNPESYVELQLRFSDGQLSKIFTEPLSNIDYIDWFKKDKRCVLSQPYLKAKQFIASRIRFAVANAPTPAKKRYRLDRLGVHCIDQDIIFFAGDRVITRSPEKETMPDVDFAQLPFRLDIDTASYPKQVAFDGMRELVSISCELGRPLLAHAISAITRSAYIDAGAPPCTVLEIIASTGSFKTYYSATVTQLYNRADEVEPVTRLNSSDRFIEEILFDYSECTVVIDDKCTAQSSKIKKKNEDTAEEIMRRVGDKTGRGRMDGKKRVQIKPRGNAVFTGEYLTGRQSTVARGLTLNLTMPIDGKRMDKYQRQHPILISTFYFYFIEWYISHYEKICTELAERLTKHRETISGIHPRLRETQFCLQTSYMLFLKFCEDNGFITVEEAQNEYLDFGAQLAKLVQAQHARITPEKKKSEKLDYLKLIRKLYKSGSFRLADSVEQFNSDKHDGLIYYGCLCLRGEKLDKKIRKIFREVNSKDIINELLAQNSLKLVNNKYSIQISALKGLRFYGIWLDMLD